MFPRLAAGMIAALALTVAARSGAADEPGSPGPPVATATLPHAQPHGTVVVAASEGAAAAAWALAYEVYRDPGLRPSIDDATARVLAGNPAPEGAPSRLAELSELRLSIVRSWPATAPGPADAGPAPGAASDLVTRRLLASLGTELGAELVVVVVMDGTHPVARTMRPTTATFEGVELGPTVEIAQDGSKAFRWPGAVLTLRGIVPSTVAPAPAPPLAPKAAEAAPAPSIPTEPRPFYKSPWFWGSVGGAAAIGLSVFLISRATSSSSDVHLTGKVGP
jgi:hypothetical protein